MGVSPGRTISEMSSLSFLGQDQSTKRAPEFLFSNSRSAAQYSSNQKIDFSRSVTEITYFEMKLLCLKFLGLRQRTHR